MHAQSKNRILYVIIFLEGFAVLATELLAIRLLIPFVGGGTDTISIVIAGVLMPLAFGYNAGGKFKGQIREKLKNNFFYSTLILSIGLSYVFITVIFSIFNTLGLDNRLGAVLYVLLFLVWPIYLLGQTLPLISNYFKGRNFSRSTGKMLFFSTFGSFMGSVFTTLVLMAFIGVHHTVILVILSLIVLHILMSKKFLIPQNIVLMTLFSVIFMINSEGAMRSLGIVENNVYHTIQIHDQGTKKLMTLNNARSSLYSALFDERFEYVKFIEKNFISHLGNSSPPSDILIIGAGGFILGLDDDHNSYTYVDIDSSLQRISEKYFLENPLGKNKVFVPMPARPFFTQGDKKYDLIIGDAFSGLHDVPEQLLTQEFFISVKNKLKPGGIFVLNIITSPTFNNHFSWHIDETFRSVFPVSSRQIIGAFNGFDKNPDSRHNVIYTYYSKEESSNRIYRDNRNITIYDQINPFR